MAKKINITASMLKQIEALAGKGYTTTMIASAIKVSRSYLYSQKNMKDAIKRGHDAARQKVVDDLFARSESDQSATASIFLAKQLKVFDSYYGTSRPKSAAEATQRIAAIFEAVAKNELEPDKGDRLVSYLQSYVKAIEITELEQRVSKLEEQVEKRK